ncbi:MAG: hypothetical protein IID44_24840 [Planctomycetes bacterium]|nr:hypothetical protein [Planctomycetota bacterium]
MVQFLRFKSAESLGSVKMALQLYNTTGDVQTQPKIFFTGEFSVVWRYRNKRIRTLFEFACNIDSFRCGGTQ